MVVHTEAKVPRVAMAGRHEHAKAEKHDSGHGAGKHRHHAGQGLDPHIWLSPSLVAIQAGAMRDALVKLDPAHTADYDRNLAGFGRELAELDQKLKQAFAGLGKKRAILVFHPAWAIFAAATAYNR